MKDQTYTGAPESSVLDLSYLLEHTWIKIDLYSLIKSVDIKRREMKAMPDDKINIQRELQQEVKMKSTQYDRD